MKNLFVIIAVSFYFAAAHGNSFTYFTDYASGAVEGETCSDEGNVIISCKCNNGSTPHLPVNVEECSISNTSLIWGCRFKGNASDGSTVFCSNATPQSLSHVCDLCGCFTNSGEYGSWSASSANRVVREKYANGSILGVYRCDIATTSEYGCAAGYYQSGGSGATMTCTRCPSSGGVYGTNNIGTTDITTCCIPANSSMKDSGGAYTFTGQCCYTK